MDVALRRIFIILIDVITNVSILVLVDVALRLADERAELTILE